MSTTDAAGQTNELSGGIAAGHTGAFVGLGLYESIDGSKDVSTAAYLVARLSN